jgi:hypothetical protein
VGSLPVAQSPGCFLVNATPALPGDGFVKCDPVEPRLDRCRLDLAGFLHSLGECGLHHIVRCVSVPYDANNKSPQTGGMVSIESSQPVRIHRSTLQGDRVCHASNLDSKDAHTSAIIAPIFEPAQAIRGSAFAPRQERTWQADGCEARLLNG